LIRREDFAGVVNLTSPNPLPNRDFMRALREAWGIRTGLAVPSWLLEMGAWAIRTESELVLKSRRVVPGRLMAAGFSFLFPEWPAAARDLVARWRDGEGSVACLRSRQRSQQSRTLTKV
jgi:NAD dependent epimerase/dehydratase family enzyme